MGRIIAPKDGHPRILEAANTLFYMARGIKVAARITVANELT